MLDSIYKLAMIVSKIFTESFIYTFPDIGELSFELQKKFGVSKTKDEKKKENTIYFMTIQALPNENKIVINVTAKEKNK